MIAISIVMLSIYDSIVISIKFDTKTIIYPKIAKTPSIAVNSICITILNYKDKTICAPLAKVGIRYLELKRSTKRGIIGKGYCCVVEEAPSFVNV